MENNKVETNTGKIVTALIVLTGLYIGIKNYKQPGFWAGFAALFLLGTSLKTYK